MNMYRHNSIQSRQKGKIAEKRTKKERQQTNTERYCLKYYPRETEKHSQVEGSSISKRLGRKAEQGCDGKSNGYDPGIILYVYTIYIEQESATKENKRDECR